MERIDGGHRIQGRSAKKGRLMRLPVCDPRALREESISAGLPA
jgi:hypothetical protein